MTKDRTRLALDRLDRARLLVGSGEYLTAADILASLARKLRRMAEDERASRAMRSWGPEEKQPSAAAFIRGGRRRSAGRRERPVVRRFPLADLIRSRDEREPAGRWPPTK